MYIKPLADDRFTWCLPDRHAAAGSTAALAAAAADAGARAPTLLLPARHCLLRRVPFERHERRYLRRTVPYALEEELADRVENLHFALGTAAAGEVPVAVLERAWLRRLLAGLAAHGIGMGALLPELHCLPWREGQWTLLQAHGRCLLRHGRDAGMALPPGQVGAAVQVLLDEGAAPGRLQVLGGGEALLAALPPALRPLAQCRETDYWEALALPPPTPARLDCRQGEFAARLPWGRWWRQWRVAAMLALAVPALDAGTRLLRIESLRGETRALQEEVRAVYRGAVPRGALVDPALQLRRQVQQLRGEGGGRLLPLLARVAPLLGTQAGVRLEGIGYSAAANELRLTLLTDDFNGAEAVRARLQRAGLRAELSGSTSSGGLSRTRLRIRG